MLLLPLLLAAAAPDVISLDEALALAEQSSPAMAQSRGRTALADARNGAALAPLLPQVRGDVGYARGTANTASSVKLDSYDQFSTGVSLRQLIWDFGRSTEGLAASEAELVSAKADERAAKNDLAFAVRAAWLDAAGARALKDVARGAVENEERHQAQVQAQIGVGLRPPIDLAQVKTVLASARADLLAAEQAEWTRRLELGRVLGTGGAPAPAVVGDPLGAVDGEDAVLESLVARAMAARPELVAAEQIVTARERDVASARGDYWPSISAQASANAGGAALDALAPNAQVGVDLSWPLFSGLGTNASVRATEAAAAQARALRDAVQLQLKVDVESAQLQVRLARARLVALEEADSASAAELELAEARYKAGTGTIIELGDAQARRVSASARLAQARTDLAVSRAALLRALGS
ncbi:MAG: TolC family protein [Deltaproteobacteria bacterium]|nr:TolC family protein [Deltaproteobacteria bacterium]